MARFSTFPDHLGFHHAFVENDPRQLNVRAEHGQWAAYVGGDLVGTYPSREAAQKGAIQWACDNSEKDET